MREELDIFDPFMSEDELDEPKKGLDEELDEEEDDADDEEAPAEEEVL